MPGLIDEMLGRWLCALGLHQCRSSIESERPEDAGMVVAFRRWCVRPGCAYLVTRWERLDHRPEM